MGCSIAGGDLRVLLFTGTEEGRLGQSRGFSGEIVGTDTGTRLCQVGRWGVVAPRREAAAAEPCAVPDLIKAAIAAGDPAQRNTRFLPEQHRGSRARLDTRTLPRQ